MTALLPTNPPSAAAGVGQQPHRQFNRGPLVEPYSDVIALAQWPPPRLTTRRSAGALPLSAPPRRAVQPVEVTQSQLRRYPTSFCLRFHTWLSPMIAEDTVSKHSSPSRVALTCRLHVLIIHRNLTKKRNVFLKPECVLYKISRLRQF